MAWLLEWVGWIAAAATIWHLPSQIARWSTVRRLYGRIPWRLVWQIGVYSRKNRMLRIQIWLLWGLFFLGIVPMVTELVGVNWLHALSPPVEDTRWRRLPVLLIFLWQVDRVIGYLLPPAALLLGTGKSVNVHLVAALQQRARVYRVVSLLDAKQHIYAMYVADFMYNNLRTVNGHEWRMVVHHLMDMVPVIIVDDAVRTENVDAELRRIETLGLDYKVIRYSTEEYQDETDLMKYNVAGVVAGADKLADELAPKIKNYLEHVTDVERRRVAQAQYNAMIKCVPRALRFNPQMNAMLIKAHYILAWTMENYVRDCKEFAPDENSSRLLEDIPLKVTLAEEERYLRLSRGLDEVRGIAFTALGLSQQTPGSNQAFNIANARTKIGKVARFTHDWDTAIEHLGQAVELFQTMLASSSNREEATLTELGDAHFLLGEVHMARYRQTSSSSDREKAIASFEAAMKVDAELGHDTTETACRLRDLDLGESQLAAV